MKTNDGLAIKSASHTLMGFKPPYGETPELSESCFEILHCHTIVKNGKNVTFIYQDENDFFENLKYALRFGEKKLNFSLHAQ